MRTKFFLPVIAAALVFAATMFGNATRLNAQCTNPCTYQMVACAGDQIPANCFPIPVLTQWNMNGTTRNKRDTITGPGLTTYSQPTGCPPEGAIIQASITNGASWATPSQSDIVVLPCGLQVCVQVFIDSNGCVTVRICLTCV